MTDRPDAERSRRILRFAVLGSLVVHAIGFVLWGIAWNGFESVRVLSSPTPPPEVVVATSNAIRIEKRARPQPVRRPARPRPRPSFLRPQQPRPERVAVAAPRALTEPAIPRPRTPEAPRPRALHEVAKSNPQALPNPPRTVRATERPRPEPTLPSKQEQQPQRVALAQRPLPAERPVPTNRQQLSRAQLARISEDIQKTLQELHAESNPLAVHSTAAPSAEHRYRVQMLGVPGEMRHAQGTCYPIKSWVSGRYDYYYESCEVLFQDGHYETQAVPWPIRYPIGHDIYHGDLGEDVTVPLPPPLPGWKLPPGERVSDELRQYAREHGVDI